MSPSRKLIAVLAVLSLVALAGGGVWLGGSPAGAAGGTIAAPDGPGVVGQFSSLALDGAGKPVVSYFDATHEELKVLHCGNPTCTAGNTIVAPDTATESTTSLALDGAGNPVISYFDEASDELKVLHCGNSSCTAGNTIAVPDTLPLNSTSLSLALDAAGNPVVAYVGVVGATTRLRVLHCGNPTCTTGNTITAPGSASSVHPISLALDAAGNPVVSYVSGGLKVLHCGNPTCTAGNTIATPAAGASEMSLALDAAGNPVVSYTSGGLKLLRCGNPACTAGNTITTPDTGSLGVPSLALDAAGNPVVSYFDVLPNFDLKLLHCGDATCSAGNTIVAPDTAGAVGDFPSLSLDAAGNPVVSYADFTNGDLRVLHCADPTCSGVKSTPTPKPTRVPPPSGGLDFSIGIDTDGDTTDDCSTSGLPTGPETPAATKTPGSPNLCELPPGAAFQLNVYLNSVPAGVTGYEGFDFAARYVEVSPKSVAIGPPSSALYPVFDITWPDCVYQVGAIVTGRFRTPKIAVGCGIGIAAPPSAYTGKLVAIDFNCTASGAISMVHGTTVERREDGSYVDSSNTALTERGMVVPPVEHVEGNATTETLTVNCVVPTPPPPVGGISIDAHRSRLPLKGKAQPDGTNDAVLPVAAVVAATVALSAGAWYARRRLG